MFETSIQFALRLGNKHSADIATWNTWLSRDYLAFWNLVLDASAALPGRRAGRTEIKWLENERGTIYRKHPLRRKIQRKIMVKICYDGLRGEER